MTSPDRLRKRAPKPADPFNVDTRVSTRKPEREADYRAAIMNDDRLSIAASWIATCLIFRFWQSGEVYAGQKRIAEIAKYSRHSTDSVRKALAELVERGYLEHVGTLPDRREHYRFTIPVGADTSEPEPEDAPEVVHPAPAAEIVQEAPLEPWLTGGTPEPVEAPTADVEPPVAAPAAKSPADVATFYDQLDAEPPAPFVPVVYDDEPDF